MLLDLCSTTTFCVWALLTWAAAIEEVLQRMQPRGKMEIGSISSIFYRRF